MPIASLERKDKTIDRLLLVTAWFKLRRKDERHLGSGIRSCRSSGVAGVQEPAVFAIG
jgi:hypothetical protein